MKKHQALASIALFTSALGHNACGGRTELSSPTYSYPETDDAGTAGFAGEQADSDTPIDAAGGFAGMAGTGGAAGEAGASGEGGQAGLGGQGGTGPEAGTLTISADTDPAPIVAEKQAANLANFRIEADNVEGQLIEKIRLKVEAAQCDGTGIKGPIYLHREGSSSPVALGSYQDQGGYMGYLDFEFPTPYLIAKGTSSSFQVLTTQSAGCCHFTEETFLENAGDLIAKGDIYGAATTITNNYSENDTHSSVEIWGGDVFVDYYTQQPALNIPIGTVKAACLDTTVYNCLPENSTLQDLQAQLEITNGDSASDAKDLLNNNPVEGNFPNVQLLQREFSGLPLQTLAGPNELNTASSDETQLLPLSGTPTLAPGERAHLSLSFDVAQNQALVGNQIRCTLKNLSSVDLVSPVHTIVAHDFPCVSVEAAPTPPSGTLQKGAQDIEIACWDLSNSCYQTNLVSLTAEHYGTGGYQDLHNLGLFRYGTSISDSANFDTSGQATFSNLTDTNDNTGYNIGSGALHRICVQSDVSFSAISGSIHGVQISSPTDLTLNPPTPIGGQFPVQGPAFVIGGL